MCWFKLFIFLAEWVQYLQSKIFTFLLSISIKVMRNNECNHFWGQGTTDAMMSKTAWTGNATRGFCKSASELIFADILICICLETGHNADHGVAMGMYFLSIIFVFVPLFQLVIVKGTSKVYGFQNT